MSTSEKSLQILMVAPPMDRAAGQATLRLARELRRRGHLPHLVSSGRIAVCGDWAELASDLNRQGIPWHILTAVNRDPSCVRTLVDQMLRLLHSSPFDLMHVHSAVPAFAALEARRNLGFHIPMVLTLHRWETLRPTWMNLYDIQSFNQCDGVVTLSREHARRLQEWGMESERCRTIRWGTDPEREGQALRAGTVPAPFRIAAAGPITPTSGIETVIEAFSEFLRRVPHAELRIALSPPDRFFRVHLEERMELLGCREQVRMRGTPPDTNPECLEQADIFVAASPEDGQSHFLINAMGRGIPAVCTRTADHQEIAEEGITALMFHPGNAQELARQLLTLHRQPEKSGELARNARHAAVANFSWPRVAEAYLEAYGQILRRKPAAAA